MQPVNSTPNAVARPALAYRFGPYELNTARNELRKFGLRIKLERKPLQLLIALVERAGETVVRGELRRSMWAEDIFVDFDNSLKVAVTKLRAALNDSAEKPKYVETVAAEGYRFIAEVEKIIAPQPTPAPAPANVTNSAAVDVPSQGASWRGYSTPEVRSDVWPSSVQRWKRWRRAAVFAGVAVVAGAVAIFAWRHFRQPMPVHAAKIMLVVVPFENLSGDPGQEYFSDGLTEELSAQLGNLNPQRLGVIGRTSAMTYKHSHSTIAQIGKDLGVDYVLEGSVRREENKLRVTAQLVHASDQAHVWAEIYDRDMGELLQLEADIAGNIAREVDVSITALANPPAALRPNPEAHEAYLLGRYYWNRRAHGDWKAAEEHFRRAIRLDSQYALAYAGLAECRIRREEASAAALRAAELDPASAEARISLGWAELYGNLDLDAGGRAFRSAVQLDPNYASAHHSYGEYLAMVGRFEEAIAEKRQAVLLDPLSVRFRGALAEVLAYTGQVDAALKEMKTVQDLQPDRSLVYASLAEIHLRAGRYNEAIRELQLYAEHGEDPISGRLGYAYAKSGRRKDAERILAKMRNWEAEGRLPDIVLVEIGLGHNEEALAWLEKCYQLHVDEELLWLKTDPFYDPLRSDPRFQALLRKMNFPQ